MKKVPSPTCSYCIHHILVFFCVVHGFDKAFDNVTEGDSLRVIFSLNVKGTRGRLQSVRGMVTSQSDTARKLLLIFILYSLAIYSFTEVMSTPGP